MAQSTPLRQIWNPALYRVGTKGTEMRRRRFQLQRDPDAYVFGTEDGRRVRGFRRTWRELFQLAGMRFGRSKGLTWHTIRHEFVSRAIETIGDPVVTQKLARHKEGRTTHTPAKSLDSRRAERGRSADRGASPVHACVGQCLSLNASHVTFGFQFVNGPFGLSFQAHTWSV